MSNTNKEFKQPVESKLKYEYIGLINPTDGIIRESLKMSGIKKLVVVTNNISLFEMYKGESASGDTLYTILFCTKPSNISDLLHNFELQQVFVFDSINYEYLNDKYDNNRFFEYMVDLSSICYFPYSNSLFNIIFVSDNVNISRLEGDTLKSRLILEKAIVSTANVGLCGIRVHDINKVDWRGLFSYTIGQAGIGTYNHYECEPLYIKEFCEVGTGGNITGNVNVKPSLHDTTYYNRCMELMNIMNKQHK